MLSDGAAARAKGSRSRLRHDLTGALNDDLRTHGAAVIDKLRKEKPVEYFKLILSLLPEETAAERSPFFGVDNDELHEILEAARKSLRDDASGGASQTADTPLAEPAPTATPPP